MKFRLIWLFPLLAAILFADCDCEPAFDPAGKIKTQRFLGITADPLEAAPGEEITFSALVVNKDGTPHEGPIAWFIATGDPGDEEEDALAEDAAFFETEETGPFVWTVPGKEELEKTIGPLGEYGIMLTVMASMFPGGDPDRSPITTFKYFVISERPEGERMKNPVIAEVKVTTRGDTLSTNEDGEYVTDYDNVKIKIVPEAGETDLTFHWFSANEDFESEMESEQEVDTGGRSLTSIYCVVRKAQYFFHDENQKTLMTGMNWAYVPIRRD